MKTKREQLEQSHGALKSEQSSWTAHWQDIEEYIQPRRGRFLVTDHNKGDKRHQEIINNTATLALRTLRSGMMSGLTSPARPWFRLATPDPAMMEYAPIKQWLYTVEARLRELFLRSNLYNAMPNLYGDCGGYGTAAMAAVQDTQDGMRFYTFPVGSYQLGLDERMRVNTFFRESKWTARQIVERFGDKEAGPTKRWGNISAAVQDAYNRGDYQTTYSVVHAVMPNPDHDPNKLLAKFKKYQSVYYETGAERRDRFLAESGFDDFPILAPRWEVAGEDVYGGNCPGMEALGDVKALQTMEKRKAEAIEKIVRPPMTADPALKHQHKTTRPNEVTYVNNRKGGDGFRPTYEVNPQVQALIGDIREHEGRISRTFYEDLFLMLATSDRRQITAREIQERHEEKLLMLGPVLERLNDELLDPLIDRAFAVLWQQGKLPEPPAELEEVPLKVEYISIMAQAQKMAASGGMERFLGFAGNVAAAKPEALDRIDEDQVINEYADMMGVPPTILRSDEAVADIRRQRAEAAAQQQQRQQAAENIQGAKVLSETRVDEGSALDRVLGRNG